MMLRMFLRFFARKAVRYFVVYGYVKLMIKM